jgi:integrase
LLKRYIGPRFEDMALGAMKTSTVRSWHQSLAREHSQTAAKAYRLLRLILDTAVTDRLIVTNPCKVKGAAVEHAPERSIPTVAELDVLIDAMPERLRLLVQLAAWCGLRRGELLALVRGDLDLEQARVRVERACYQLNDGQVVVGEPKTAAGRRTVHWPPGLTPQVEEHLRKFVGEGSDALVFTGEKGARLRPHVLQDEWERARRHVGVTYTIHDLRHLGATLAAATGASTRELMKRLGHASPDAALRYQHATEDRDAVIAAALWELTPNASVVALRGGQKGLQRKSSSSKGSIGP